MLKKLPIYLLRLDKRIAQKNISYFVKPIFQKKLAPKIIIDRCLNEQSWASDMLKEKGEMITEASKSDPILISEETISQPSEKVKQLASDIMNLNVLEVQQMLRVMQKRLGFSDEFFYGGAFGYGSNTAPAPTVNTSQETAKAPEPVKEKTIFDIKLGAVDAKAKIKIIKEVRTITGLGLKEVTNIDANLNHNFTSYLID